MPYSPEEDAVLKKYKILMPDGTPRLTRTAEGELPLMREATIAALLAADTTPDRRWLDWIFFQAGGGEKAKANTSAKLGEVRDRFLRQRINGYTEGDRDPNPGQHHPGIPEANARALWQRNEQRFRDFLAVSDQDMVEALKTFGYYRDWDKRYAQVVGAISKYLKVYKKLIALKKNSVEILPTTPEEIPDIETMERAGTRVEQHYAAQAAPTDLRIANDKPIYSDDNIVVLAPLTYAAAVRYGYQAWPWANEREFKQTLAGREAWRGDDPWKGATRNGFMMVYMKFKSPVPGWMTRGEHRDLTDLAMIMDKKALNENPDDWTVYDQENRNTLTVSGIKQMILNEPARVDAEETFPPRGANAYSTQEEAQAVVNSFDNAIKAVYAWLRKFDPKKVKSDVLTL